MTAVSASQAAGANPLVMSRNVALVHATIYDAVNAIDRRHTVYAVDVKVKPGASIEAAAAIAAYGVLTKLYWLQTPVFDVALEASLAAITDGPSKPKASRSAGRWRRSSWSCAARMGRTQA